MIVADANIVLSWFVEGAVHPTAEAALEYVAEHGACVPGNFLSEVTQGLLRAERRGLVDQSSSVAALDEILSLRLRTESGEPHLVLSLAREHQLSTYDASYLAVAMRYGLLLATLDASLAHAAAARKVLWAPPAR